MKSHEPPFELKELKLEVTHQCSLHCVHCSSDASPSSTIEMTENECNRIILEALELGVQEIVFSGGEPLIWSPLEKAINIASKNGLKITIYTSGNVPNISEKITLLKSLGVNKCIFSLFGASALSHDRITRHRGSFDITLKAIEYSYLNKLNPEIHFVPFNDNFREIDNIAKIAEKYNVNRISVLRFVTQGRGYLYKKHVLSKLQNIELKNRIKDLRKRGFNIRTGSPYNFLLINDNAQCPSGIDRLIVTPDLRIYPCDAFKQIKAEEIVGTLDYSTLVKYSLIDCWNNSPFLLAVREYLTTPFAKPCENCSVLEFCLSGCLAQKAVINGNLEKCPDPDCLFNTSLKD
ncbi:radical SAM protein [candidate division KSB1 bacterium]